MVIPLFERVALLMIFFNLVFSTLLWHRNEIASCEETAYESLPLKDAATLLFFTTQTDLLTFAQQVCFIDRCYHVYFNHLDSQRGWQVNLAAGNIDFARKSEEQMEIPKERLIAANLAYARELEQIV